MGTFFNTINTNIAIYAPRIILAVVVLYFGFGFIKQIIRLTHKQLVKNDDPTLNRFLENLIGILLKAMLFISVASMVGIETTSFVAVLGAGAFAVGLALQGSLANFAGGVLLILFRPFKVGDVLEAQGFTGIVHEISIFTTIIKSFDNKTIIIPNGPLASGNMVNYSTESERRVDMVFGISYSDDMDKAISIIQEHIQADGRIFKDITGKEPFVRVTELANSSVNITVRMWVKSADYWGIYFDMLEKVKKSFDSEGISFPFPQIQVHTSPAMTANA